MGFGERQVAHVWFQYYETKFNKFTHNSTLHLITLYNPSSNELEELCGSRSVPDQRKNEATGKTQKHKPV